MLRHHALMATPPRILSITRRTFSAALKFENGVSMVQGASRGIGLEFVRFCFLSGYLLLLFFFLGIWFMAFYFACVAL